MESLQLEGNKLAIIAGSGRLPVLCAEEAVKKGAEIFLFKLSGECSLELADTSIANKIVKTFEIKVGQLGKLIKLLKKEKITLATFVGGVRKPNFFSFFSMDFRAISLLKRIQSEGTGDDRLLRAVAGELSKEGISLIGSAEIIPQILVPKGLLTKRELSEQEKNDAELGFKIAAEIGTLDIGQAVVVRQGSIIAVEAIEGTNAMLERAAELSGLLNTQPKENGLVLVKRAKPQQDLRLDLPTIGSNTIELMKKCGATALVLEAGRCQAVDLQNIILLADRYKLSIISI